MNKYEKNYRLLEQLGILDTINSGGHYAKSTRSGYMDLHLDVLGKEDDYYIISLAHNYVVNGNVCADPDMQIRVFTQTKTAEAMTFQQAIPPVWQEVYPKPGQVNTALKQSLNAFLKQWLTNLTHQKHGFKQQKTG